MKIAIIDAEIVGKPKHRFPNLACMKLSTYYKQKGEDVSLVYEYRNLFSGYVERNVDEEAPKDFLLVDVIKTIELIENKKVKKTVNRYYCKKDIVFDKIFISKVFTKTPCPIQIMHLDICEYGGTGFFYDKASPLSPEKEHIKPDYHLYDEWIEEKIFEGSKSSEFTYYTDYSIGFLTRGCFRKCEFCVNKNCTSCESHSSVYEFLDESRPKLCFLDDNFFACKDWRNIIAEVKSTGLKFQFKQGLDERLLNDEKIHEIVTWNYDGDYIFAFDNIEDNELIESKLKRIFDLYPNFKGRLKFYVLCGYDRNEKWDFDFWIKDINDTFERCFILAKYSALPYIMRYEKCYESEFAGLYSSIASWANQPSLFKKFDFATYSMCRGMGNKNYKKYKRDIELYLNEGGKKGSTWRYMDYVVENHKEIADKYFYIVPDSLLEYGNGKKYEAS